MDTVMLGKRIRKARKDAGLTGEKLSEMCGINAAYLRQIECGAKTPSLPLFVILCRELKVSPSYLLIEVLPGCENRDIEALLLQCKNAAPRQIELLTSMLQSFTVFVENNQRD